jgi:hypothetical protein
MGRVQSIFFIVVTIWEQPTKMPDKSVTAAFIMLNRGRASRSTDATIITARHSRTRGPKGIFYSLHKIYFFDLLPRFS